MSQCHAQLFGVLVGTLLLSACPPLVAQDPTRMQPKHVAQLRYVTSAAISPDGKLVAYNIAVPRRPLDDDNGPVWSELHVTDMEGNSRPFITGQQSIGAAHWSPDGKSIYYTAKRSGDEEKVLYRIPIDGGESTRVFTHATSIGSFDIAPDGKSVAFLAQEKADKDQKEIREKGFDQQIYEEDWKPTRVWVAAIDSDGAATDDSPNARMLDLEGSASAVQWSPSGRELMVVLAPSPSVDDSYMFQGVHVVDAESGRVIRSVPKLGKLGAVVWSPDGKQLAIISGEDINDPREGRLMVTAIDDDQGLTDVLPDLKAHVHTVAWKDESTIYWLAAEGVSSRFGSVTLSGQSQTYLPPGGETVLSGFSKAENADAVAFLGHTASHPAEVFGTTDATAEPSRVTDVNPWLSDMRFARQTAISWKARDGLDLQGVLVYPLGYVEGRRYPTIMYVHGGPESHESNGWITSYSRPGQVAAAQGFVVFYPNYRGSTGRGVEFSKMGQADAAGKEFDDLIDGIDHLIEMGLADPDAIGVTGGSYGGYASAWCSTYYSDRFAASVMFVGISDNVSKVGTTDIPEEMFLVHHMKRLWDDWEYFLDRSPIRYVQRNRTATLIMHGKEDPRVHPSQSLELYRHLKTLDQAPVRLVLYQGEGHGNRKAASKLDYNIRMLRWMKHYLQDKSGELPPLEIDYHQALGKPRGDE